MDHQHVFRQAGLSWKVLATVVSLIWQTRQSGEWQVIWCFGSHQVIHDVESLCISLMWLFNFLLLERTLKQELQKWQQRPMGIWLSCPPPPPGCPAYAPCPSSFPPSPPPHHHPPSSPTHPSLLPQLPLHWDVCIQAGPAPSQGFKVMTGLKLSQVILIFRCLSSWQNLKNLYIKKNWKKNWRTKKGLKRTKKKTLKTKWQFCCCPSNLLLH